MAEKRKVAWIDAGAHSKEHNGFRVSFVIEGERQHCPTGDTPEGGLTAPWYWGPKLEDAERMADEYNEKRGISKEDAMMIVGKSMFG